MADGPLSGLTAVELCQSVAGPYAGMILSDLGCRVIKVERPGSGDDAREWGPPFWNGESPSFLALNRNKESVVLDLKRPQDRSALHGLVAQADIFLANYRPKVLAGWGLSYEELGPAHPRLVYCNISAFGSQGPLADAPGYDPLLQAFSGVMSVTGEPGRPPVRTGPAILDLGTGLWAALGIMTALYERRETGRGKQIAVSLLETALSLLSLHIGNFMASGQDPRPQGSGTGFIAPYQAFETQDGYVVIAAGNDPIFRRLCQALGHSEWADDPRFAANRDRVRHLGELAGMITAVLKTQTSAYWEARLQKHAVPCSPVRSVSQALAHPQTQAIEILRPLPHPHVPDLRVVGSPIQFDGRRPEVRSAPPTLGQHTRLHRRDETDGDA